LFCSGDKKPTGAAAGDEQKAEEKKVDDISADVLRDVCLSVKPGSLVAIIGAVGSGKSSLLAGLLGELKRTQGSVKLRGRVGYCPQQAWIQNASVRNNM
jgi:ABC-type Mn2+/Zn2+ transport system ATPase subunit